MKTTNKYVVNFDMTWSHDIKVKAQNKTHAKKIAFALFIKKLKGKDFNISVDKEDTFFI